MKVVLPRGRLPKTPAELKERLEEQLAPGLRAKINIVVIDVSLSGRYRRDGWVCGLIASTEPFGFSKLNVPLAPCAIRLLLSAPSLGSQGATAYATH